MLKRVSVEQLRVGMYVQELCSSWIDSPFWQKSFVVDDAAVIDKLIQHRIREAWIDVSKGLDLAAEQAPAAPTIPAFDSAPPAGRYAGIERVSMDEEVGRAAKIVNKSRQAVVAMFHEARLGKAVDAEGATSLIDEIASSVLRNPGALIGLARLKTADDYTYMHSVAVCALMIALARQLGLDDERTRDAGLAGLLHDIGKMAVPPEVLNKPGKLIDAEFVSIKGHPAAGHRMLLEGRSANEICLDVCLHHHEKMDGTGYPHGLAGEQISLYARMAAVCDVYDAITSDRPYKQGWCPAESLRKMAEWSKRHFDDIVFRAFVKSVGIYPVGTLVRLKSGRIGIVVEQPAGRSLLQPKVRVFFSTRSVTYIPPELVDLGAGGGIDGIVASVASEEYGLKDAERYLSA